MLKALLLLLPAAALASPIPLMFEVITSHDDLLAAVTCKARHYRFMWRGSRDNVLCIRDYATAANAHIEPINVDAYIRQHVAAMQGKGAG